MRLARIFGILLLLIALIWGGAYLWGQQQIEGFIIKANEGQNILEVEQWELSVLPWSPSLQLKDVRLNQSLGRYQLEGEINGLQLQKPRLLSVLWGEQISVAALLLDQPSLAIHKLPEDTIDSPEFTQHLSRSIMLEQLRVIDADLRYFRDQEPQASSQVFGLQLQRKNFDLSAPTALWSTAKLQLDSIIHAKAVSKE